MQRVVIIGGGLSGTLLVIYLLRINRQPLDIIVIDKNPPGTLGVAYSTDEDFHLLNVPAGKMSVFPDKPDDFLNWLKASGYSYHGGSFVPRRIYKKYIQNLLASELSATRTISRYTFIQEKALDIHAGERLLMLESGRMIPFDKLVLAIGNFNPAGLPIADKSYLDHPAYFGSGWDHHLFGNVGENMKILILGTGLTMVDTVLTLKRRQHFGSIIALSTHGLTPMAYRESIPYPISDLPSHSITTCLKALTIVNSHIKKAKQQGVSWHSVIDAVRPFTQQIWRNLPVTEKRIFMEHVRHIWGVARHRMPLECAHELYELIKQELLSIVAGRIRSIRENSAIFSVEYQQRQTGKKISIEVDLIINCMGPEQNYRKLQDALIRNLLRRSLIRTDELQQGIDCTPEGVIINEKGVPSSWLYTIGPPMKGILWEITSVPEIRIAALKLAELILLAKGQLVF
jgi:uncharacterized NAD(P)/FAD-binding protein YdhS